jgi:ABC-type dipeptide/oligopeptide/nickel transport system permease subunit
MPGGATVLIMAFIAVAVVYSLAIPIGMVAAYRRGWLDNLIMRSADVVLAFPSLLIVLVLAATRGPGPEVLIIGVVISFLPSIARVVRAASLEVVVRNFVDSARLRGESTATILGREILPNISNTLSADVGFRVAYAILAIGAGNFLGFGLKSPTADWGLMVGENSAGLQSNPVSVLAPALIISLLTVGVALVADSIARSHGTGEAGLIPTVELEASSPSERPAAASG